MTKKKMAAILRDLHLHMAKEVLAEMAAKYPAHFVREGQCRNSTGIVKQEDHPLRGWYDYTCPHCGQAVRVVFSPSSGGGITRYWGLDLPKGPVEVKVSPNSTMVDGVQYDVLDLAGPWLATFHPATWALYRLNPLGSIRITDWVDKRIGNPFKAIVVEAPMRTLIIYPQPLLPPWGWKAEGKYFLREFFELAPKIRLPFKGEAYAVPYPRGRFLLLTRPQLELI